MTRLKFLLLGACAPLVLWGQRIRPDDVGANANEFARCFNIWAEMRKDPLILDVHEPKAWADAVAAWKKLVPIVRYK